MFSHRLYEARNKYLRQHFLKKKKKIEIVKKCLSKYGFNVSIPSETE
jgi:hypothetical protein